ncbi:MAG: class I SAM-dependent methyltransferase [Pseudomonadales bacterium]
MNKGEAHWSKMSAAWKHVGPPLRPSPSEQALFNQLIEYGHPNTSGENLALILGVTAELLQLNWPSDTRVLALDSSPEMIGRVWPGDKSAAIAGSWTQAPFRTGSLDTIVLDGGFGLLPYPDGQKSLLLEICRLLSPGGLFVVRLFAPSGRTDSLDLIRADINSQAVQSLDELKFRLWGVLQQEPISGVRPADVVAMIDQFVEETGWQATTRNWQPEHLKTLDFHRQSKACYHLVDAEAFAKLVRQVSGLDVISVQYPDHKFGGSCPIVCVQRQASDERDQAALPKSRTGGRDDK